nr:hypothetical protein [Tanacetum cinerariifolium]
TASTQVNTASTPVNTASTPVNTASPLRNVSADGPSYSDLLTYANQGDSQIPSLEDIYEIPNDGIFTSASYDAEGAVAYFTNLESIVNIEPKKISQALKDESWVDAMQEELLAWYATLSTFLVKSGYKREIIDKTMFIKKDNKDIMMVKQREDGIFISQDKYFAEILKKFNFMSVKTASTIIETKKPLVKDAEAVDVDVHLYISMIGSLMYLTTSRPDIMRLISWQCKRQTIVATSTIEAEYVAAANCCGSTLSTAGKSWYNMVAYLEKIEGNAQFHEIVDFLSCIHLFRSGFSKNEKFGSMYPNMGEKG